MTKDMPQKGFELVIYQLGEVKTGIGAMSAKLDGFQDRLTALEQWRAIMESQKKDNQGVMFDWIGENAMTKIAILALTIALAVVGLVSNGVIK